MCLARRYVNCRACGGLYHRSIFVHVRSKAQVQPCTKGSTLRRCFLSDARPW